MPFLSKETIRASLGITILLLLTWILLRLSVSMASWESTKPLVSSTISPPDNGKSKILHEGNNIEDEQLKQFNLEQEIYQDCERKAAELLIQYLRYFCARGKSSNPYLARYTFTKTLPLYSILSRTCTIYIGYQRSLLKDKCKESIQKLSKLRSLRRLNNIQTT